MGYYRLWVFKDQFKNNNTATTHNINEKRTSSSSDNDNDTNTTTGAWNTTVFHAQTSKYNAEFGQMYYRSISGCATSNTGRYRLTLKLLRCDPILKFASSWQVGLPSTTLKRLGAYLHCLATKHPVNTW